MKKISLFIVFLLALMSGNLKAQSTNWSYYAAPSFASGTGSSRNPYVISTPEQLAYLANRVNSGVTYSGTYFRLDADLDLVAYYWTPIGTTSGGSTRYFRGVFNGNGKTIKNLITFGRTYQGLFGLTESAQILNLNIVDCNLLDVNGDYMGGLVGRANGGYIVNCSVTGTVGGNLYIGGLIGYASYDSGSYTFCSVTDCHSEANVMGSGMVGGLAGYTGSSNISRCSATGNVRGLSWDIGGLVGEMDYCVVTDCYAVGAVTGAANVGGLIGIVEDSSTITGCFSAGSVTGAVVLFGQSDIIGGLIGYMDDSSVEDCFSVATVAGDRLIGGLVGRPGYSSIIDCYAVGTVTGSTAVGGLTGTIISGRSIQNCYAAGAVVVTSDYGGFSGMTVPYTYGYACFDQQATGMIQATGNDDEGNIESFSTRSLTDGVLPTAFSKAKWQTDKGYYPQLKYFVEHSNLLFREWSALSVTPLLLDNEEELCSNVNTSFSLVDKTASGAAITYSISPDNTNSVDNFRVTCDNKGEWNRLTLTSGECSREIAFRSVNGFSEADLYAFVVDGKRYEPKINTPTRIVIDCKATDYETLVRLEMSTFATASTGNIIAVKTDKPALIKYDITITSVDGDKIQKYTLEVEKPFSKDIFVQRWADVLAVNNNSATNGGYTFTDNYQWYRNGALISGATKGYIQELGGLNRSVDYTAVLTSQYGTIKTCPAEILNTTIKAAVYPNPVQRGQTVRVETGIGEDGDATAVMQLFDVRGNIIAKQTLNDPVAEIAMPDMPGQYILQVMVNGVAQTFKIVVE